MNGDYFPLPSEYKRRDSDVELVVKGKSVNNNSGELLKRIKKNTSDYVEMKKKYQEKNAKELFSVDLFFDLKLLRNSVKYVLSEIEKISKINRMARLNLKISSYEGAFLFIKEIYKIQQKINNDPLLKDNTFLNLWAKYVFETFTALLQELSKAINIPIRESSDDTKHKYEEGMYLYLDEGHYSILIWWHAIPFPVPRKSDIYSFY